MRSRKRASGNLDFSGGSSGSENGILWESVVDLCFFLFFIHVYDYLEHNVYMCNVYSKDPGLSLWSMDRPRVSQQLPLPREAGSR